MTDDPSGDGGDGRRAVGAATRARLLRAATELIVEGGPDAATVRAVSGRAGTNVAAVSYHFGSRRALIAAVVESISKPIVEEQRQGLARLETRPSPASADEWVAAWGRPLLRAALSPGPEARQLGNLIGQALAAPRSELDDAVREVVLETDERLVAGLLRAQPGTEEGDVRLRLAVMATVVAGLASGGFESHLSRAEPDQRLDERLLLILTRIATATG